MYYSHSGVVTSDAASEHQTIVASSADRKNKRIRLGIAYPVGIESFIEDIKRSKEPACGNRNVAVRRVVEFDVVNRLGDLSREITRVSVTALEVALKRSA